MNWNYILNNIYRFLVTQREKYRIETYRNTRHFVSIFKELVSLGLEDIGKLYKWSTSVVIWTFYFIYDGKSYGIAKVLNLEGKLKLALGYA